MIYRNFRVHSKTKSINHIMDKKSKDWNFHQNFKFCKVSSLEERVSFKICADSIHMLYEMQLMVSNDHYTITGIWQEPLVTLFERDSSSATGAVTLSKVHSYFVGNPHGYVFV